MIGSNIKRNVTAEQEGLPVKQILSQDLGFSRREITRLNAERGIFLNGETCRLSQPVKNGDVLEVQLKGKDQARGVLLEGKPTILFEDEHMVIVNKPAGMPAHASKEHPDDDMGSLLERYYEGHVCPRPVGRLDKGVSGIMIYAKSRKAAALLSSQRAVLKLHKEYLAVARGHFREKQGTLEYALKRDAGKHNRKVAEDGQVCITDYKVEKEYPGRSLVRISIRTGRTHQIRAGMAYFKHVLIGDRLYGDDTKEIRRPALHCADMELCHPFTGEQMHIHCDLPDDMNLLLREKN